VESATARKAAAVRYFEDYAAGSVAEFGSVAVEEEEIISFARRFDPQSFHIDPETAKRSHFGGLVASGWHTASLAMRLLVEHFLSEESSMGSPGVDEIRWLKPVRPGDVLSLRVTVLEATRSRSKPDRGAVRSFTEVLNQRREVVMSMKGTSLLRCRATSAPGGR
jgi:acyl dehydratase